jgi:ABC-type phosphate transport system substrate-binding protein
MQYLKWAVFFFVVVIYLVAPSAGAQDVVLIASPDVPVDSLSASDIENIFLGKKTTWDNGSKIVFYTLKDGSAHESFLKNYVSKSASQFKTFWKKQVFTGKGKMPKSFGNDQEMANAITGTGSAIGYVSSGTDLGNVKKLSVR